MTTEKIGTTRLLACAPSLCTPSWDEVDLRLGVCELLAVRPGGSFLTTSYLNLGTWQYTGDPACRIFVEGDHIEVAGAHERLPVVLEDTVELRRLMSVIEAKASGERALEVNRVSA